MLILVRHGRTAANAAGLLQGRLDPALDEVGHEQAGRIGALLRREPQGTLRVVSSPLLRARQTASYVSDEVEVDERLQEIAYGEFEGRPLTDVSPSEWARWRADPQYAPEGGESLAALLARVRPALEELAAQSVNRDIVVVSHVSPIKAAIAWALNVGIEISWRCQLDQASISRIAISPRGPSLRTYNDTAHLG
ncbi:MAG: histidine phosphatase family protein [Actinomycetota bacterium]